MSTNAEHGSVKSLSAQSSKQSHVIHGRRQSQAASPHREDTHYVLPTGHLDHPRRSYYTRDEKRDRTHSIGQVPDILPGSQRGGSYHRARDGAELHQRLDLYRHVTPSSVYIDSSRRRGTILDRRDCEGSLYGQIQVRFLFCGLAVTRVLCGFFCL